MKKTLSTAIAAALIATAMPSTVLAQEGGEDSAQEGPSPERLANLRRAGHILRSFNVALQSDQVKPQVKARLMACLYNNKLSTISVTAGNAIREGANLSDDNPTDVYRAAAGVCGITFQANGGEQAPAEGTEGN